MARATKVSRRESNSWLINGECFLAAIASGFLLFDAFQWHPAICITIGVVVGFVLWGLLVHIDWFFWLFVGTASIVAASIAGYFVHRETMGDWIWAGFAAAVAALLVAGMHAAARHDIQIEQNADEIEIIN